MDNVIQKIKRCKYRHCSKIVECRSNKKFCSKSCRSQEAVYEMRERNKIKKEKVVREKKFCQKEYTKNKRKTDYIFKLKSNIRNSIRNSINNRGHKKVTKTEIILGCSFSDFKKYLESKFESWMNWNNYGKYNGELNYGWDIDHIIPLSSGESLDDIIKLNHYTNLQPLCSKVNRVIKRGKIII